jgi:hypothetical protein
VYQIKFSETNDTHAIRQWVEEHCKGKYFSTIDLANWQSDGDNLMYVFELEQDAVLFALRWL